MTTTRRYGAYVVAAIVAVAVLGFVFIRNGETNAPPTHPAPDYCKLIGEQPASATVAAVVAHPEAALTAAALALPNADKAPEEVRAELEATADALRAGDLAGAQSHAAAVDALTPSLCP